MSEGRKMVLTPVKFAIREDGAWQATCTAMDHDPTSITDLFLRPEEFAIRELVGEGATMEIAALRLGEAVSDYSDDQHIARLKAAVAAT